MTVEKIVACLAEILQKQSNEIRTLKVMTVALGSLWMEQMAREGMSVEQVQAKYEQLLRDAEAKGPPHDPENKISTEIEEILENLDLLEKQQRNPD